MQRAPDNRGQISQGWEQRRARYVDYNRVLLRAGGGAALAWMLAGVDSDGARYPDYDQFAFYRDDATGKLLGSFSATFDAAPSCRKTQPKEPSSSPFVRVRRQPEPVALGWVGSRG